MKLFWIIFTLKIYVFCNDRNPRSVLNTIKKSFGYNCEVRPKIGEILFWKILNHQTVNRYNLLHEVFPNPMKYIQGTTQFESNETYSIITKTGQFRIYMFYWVGSHASLDDKKEAANYTLHHYSQLKNYYELRFGGGLISISREREAIESDLFQHIIISPKGNVDYWLYNYYLEAGILLKYPHLYIIRGTENTSRMKRVPMGTSWLINDTCIVLETGYSIDGSFKVFVHCGRMAKDHPQLKSFIEVLEDTNYYRPNEIDNSKDHLIDAETFIKKCDARIFLSKIFRDPITNSDNNSSVIQEGSMLKEDITGRPILYAEIQLHQANYILNTESISGVIVRFGSSVLEEAVITMNHSEEYIHNIESNTSRLTPIHVDGALFPRYTISTVDFNINFMNYPLQEDL